MNNLKKYYSLTISYLQVPLFYGQRDVIRKNKTLKMHFITEKLNLHSRSTRFFWPIYTNIKAEKTNAAKKNMLEIQSKINDADKP